jgi:translation initiation factor eIF-2B subunit beta
MAPSADPSTGPGSNALSTTSNNSNIDMSDPSQVREWLARYHPKQLALLDKFEMELRLGRLSTNTATSTSTTTTTAAVLLEDRRLVLTVRTVELMKRMIGGTKWKTPAQLMALLKGLGRELHCAGGFREPAIGNVVRRVLAAVRDEVVSPTPTTNPTTEASAAASSSTTTASSSSGRRSLDSILWALPQQQVKAHARRPSGKSSFDHRESGGGASSGALPTLTELRAGSTTPTTGLDNLNLPPAFYQPRPDLKQSVMEVIQEIMSDLEDLQKTISEQAIQHVRAGEIIFTYGRSQTVELVRESLDLWGNVGWYPLTNGGGFLNRVGACRVEQNGITPRQYE